MARALTRRLTGNGDSPVPPQTLFPQMLRAVRQFVRDRVTPLGRRQKKDVFLEPYFSQAVEALMAALVPADGDEGELPRYEAHRPEGSTRDVDFWTSRPVKETVRSHLNHVVADTAQWEQSAAYYLETDPHVVAYAKNFNLGFAIPYTDGGETREYLPDFLVRLRHQDREVGTLILETKGYDPRGHLKVAAAHRWVHAVNAEGSHGRWAYRVVTSPAMVPAALDSAARELADPPRPPDWRAALRDFTTAMRQLYGPRLAQVVLYGSRARGDADWDSDVEHGVVLSAFPAGRREFEERQTPLLLNIRREGKPVG